MPLSLISELQHPKYSKPNQHELGVIHVEPSVRNGRRSSWNSQDGTRSSLICPTERNDHLLETEVMEDSEDYISTNTSLVTEKKMNLLDEQKASQEERRFHEDAGDITETGLSNITTIPSNNMAGLGEKTDIGFPMDNSLIKPESMEISPKPHLKVPEIQPKCMDLKKYSRNFEKDLESGMLNHDYNSDQSCEELMKETKPSKLHASRYESKRLGSALESNYEKHDADPCACFESSEDFVTKEATVAENGDLVVGATNKQNGFQEEYSKFIEVNAATNLELGTIRAALNVEDSNHKENKSTKKQIVEEEQQIDPLFADENERGGEETTKKQSLPVGPAEALPPQSSSPLPQSEYRKQESALSSETVQSNHQSVTDLKQNTYGKPTYIMDSSSKHTNMKADCIVIAQLRAAETKVFEKQSNEQCAKDETSSILRRGSAANEYVERFSTDSDSSNLNVHGEMRKSPSFSLDLRIEARTEEPDGTPLLYQENSTLQSLPCQPDVSRGNPTTQNGYDQEVPLEEKIVKLERIDSEKLKTPFLGFLREEEEVNTVVKPHKQDIHSEIERKPKDLNKSPDETTTTSAKGKQKRRTRSSLFGTCMCCATV